jgi:hypothetical protein
VEYLAIAVHTESLKPLLVAKDAEGALWLLSFTTRPPLTGNLAATSPRQLFQHFKGGCYDLLGHAKDAETLEEFAIYRGVQSYNGQDTWARPRESFEAEVEVKGAMVPRFRRCDVSSRQLQIHRLP